MDRFIVAPYQLGKAGNFTHEVVDSTHPSDGGPVAICATWSAFEADKIASALNFATQD